MFPLFTSRCNNLFGHQVCVQVSFRSDMPCLSGISQTPRQAECPINLHLKPPSEQVQAGRSEVRDGRRQRGHRVTETWTASRLPNGGLDKCWTRRRRRHYHVLTLQERREQSSREVSGHSSPSCRAWEEQNVGCYQVFSVGTQHAKQSRRAGGRRRAETMFGKPATILFSCRILFPYFAKFTNVLPYLFHLLEWANRTGGF